jgi:Activator of Hsp90 ATPase homolog 1-like protein
VRTQNFTASIEVDKSPDEVYNHINHVSKWWSKDFEGSSLKLHDEFVISHTDQHYSKQKLIEVVPGKKVVWLVTDSVLNWIKGDKHEWTNTKMIFVITAKGDKTVLQFTHEGLFPEKECYARCSQGWNMVIRERLSDYITNNKGI